MNKHQGQTPRPALGLVMLLALLASSSVLAASKARPLDPKARYQRESAACSVIRDFDTRANCLSEASTRYAVTKPSPPEEQADVLVRNALKRCEPLPPAQRSDCLARMQGQGTTSGSVAGGGIYRELVTREVGVAETVQPEPTTPPAPAK
jgi:hypothetical protein